MADSQQLMAILLTAIKKMSKWQTLLWLSERIGTVCT